MTSYGVGGKKKTHTHTLTHTHSNIHTVYSRHLGSVWFKHAVKYGIHSQSPKTHNTHAHTCTHAHAHTRTHTRTHNTHTRTRTQIFTCCLVWSGSALIGGGVRESSVATTIVLKIQERVHFIRRLIPAWGVCVCVYMYVVCVCVWVCVYMCLLCLCLCVVCLCVCVSEWVHVCVCFIS